MIPQRPALERRIIASLEATPPRIPVLVGGCGMGRTSLLQRMAHLAGEGSSQYIDAERVATTPEGFFSAIVANSPYVDPTQPAAPVAAASPRAAFDAAMSFFQNAHGPDEHAATFLIDEVLELRTFESFPGLRGVLREIVARLVQGRNRFVLTSRFTNRIHRLLRDASDRFEVIQVMPLAADEAAAVLAGLKIGRDDAERKEVARLIHALLGGRPAYVRHLTDALAQMKDAGGSDPVGALAAQMAVGAPLAMSCRFCYELRLHRARGYGALKAILQILAEEEPLTLTEIAQRLRRTPGSTKDYLSWLEDVDLITVRQKRYSFEDPLLRLWVRLHGRAVPPTETDLAREVQEYAMARFPYAEPALAMADAGRLSGSPDEGDRSKAWSVVEID